MRGSQARQRAIRLKSRGGKVKCFRRGEEVARKGGEFHRPQTALNRFMSLEQRASRSVKLVECSLQIASK